MADFLRATQEYVSVLGSNLGNLRATQEYVSLLATVRSSTEFNVDASSTLSPSVSAASGSLLVTAVSVLSAGQSVELEAIPTYKSASSSLVASSTASASVLPVKHASSALSITDLARPSIWMVSASDTLSLTNSSRKAIEYPVTASNSASLTQTIASRPNRISIGNSLAFVSYADTRVKSRDVTTEITITDSAVVIHSRTARSVLDLQQLAIQGVISLQVENTLELEDSARIPSIIVRPSNTLELENSVRSSIRMLSASTSIEITDAMVAKVPWRRSVTTPLIESELIYDIDRGLITVYTGLQDSASAKHNPVVVARNTISFATPVQKALARADGTDVEAGNSLDLGEEGRQSLQEDTDSSLSMGQSAVAQVANAVADSELSDLDTSSTVNVSYGSIDANDEIEVSDSVGFYLESATPTCDYAGFGLPPYSDGTPQDYVVLQYPPNTPTDSVTLFTPNLGDRYRLGVTRINRETRGGTLEVFASPQWPKLKTLALSFSSLTRDEKQSLLDFMEAYAGQVIKFTDWEGKQWVGIITTPEAPAVQDGPGCDYTIDIEMEVSSV